MRLKEFQRRQKVDFLGKEIYIVTKEDLVLSKFRWIQILQSSIQKEDIALLLAIPNIDKMYIQHWIDELKIHSFNLI